MPPSQTAPAEDQIVANAVDAVAAPEPVVEAEAPAVDPVAVPLPARKERHHPTPDEIRRAFETGEYPYDKKVSRRAYERDKARLQAELLKVQLWAQETGQKFVLLFEGRDAAGKGGTIKRFTEHLNPRNARVVALNKPTEQERGQWYFQAICRYCSKAGLRGHRQQFRLPHGRHRASHSARNQSRGGGKAQGSTCQPKLYHGRGPNGPLSPT